MISRTTGRLFGAVLGGMALVILSSSGALWAQVDAAGFRDNTRVKGTVFNSQGEPMPMVEMWVMNDNSPADRMRMRTRGSGEYLVRSVGRLYTRDDMSGITLRISFELPGYRSAEIRTAVESNGLVNVSPILWRENEDPSQMTEWCLILRGKVTNAKGKGIRDVVVSVTDPAGSGLNVQATTEKNGTYEALLWSVPSILSISANSGGVEQQQTLSLEGSPRTDVVAMIGQDFTF